MPLACLALRINEPFSLPVFLVDGRGTSQTRELTALMRLTAVMLDGEMLLPNAVAPGHAAAVSGPAHRPSETPIAISTQRAPIHSLPSYHRASCGGAENFSLCPGAKEAPGHARRAIECDLIPLVRHTLIHSGTSLRHHYVSMQKTLFRRPGCRGVQGVPAVVTRAYDLPQAKTSTSCSLGIP